MNKEFISNAIERIDEQFIVEARADSIKQIRHIPPKLVAAVACACACAVALCVGLPIAFSHSDKATVPSHVGTENPPDTPPTGTDTPPQPPGDNNPPITDTDNQPPSGEGDTKPYFEYGYIFNGATEPASPFMIAYKMDSLFDMDAESISVQLSFGEWGHKDVEKWGMTNVVVSVYDPATKQSYELKNITDDEFAAEEYDVKIKYTMEENEYGELVTTSETRTFGHEETFTLASSIFDKDYGTLIFNIFAFDGDEYIIGGGVEMYYAKTDMSIKIITYREYKEIELAHQTPPKTDITVKPAA